MKYESVHGEKLPKVGYGTWGIGGHSRAEPASDRESIAALRSAIALGYTHFDTAERYAAGHAEELLGRALRDSRSPRESLFITSKVAPSHLSQKAVVRACEASLRRLAADYIDLYLIHWPNPLVALDATFRGLNLLVRAGKVRHLGVSNFGIRLLRKAASITETPLFTDQVPYRLTDRRCVRNGVLEYCRSNGIVLTAYSPVKPRKFTRFAAVRRIAESHGATPHQIAIAWLVAQPGVITIPASMNPEHQEANLVASDIELTEQEMDALNVLG